MKQIARAVSGAGFLIAGSILFSTSTTQRKIFSVLMFSGLDWKELESSLSLIGVKSGFAGLIVMLPMLLAVVMMCVGVWLLCFRHGCNNAIKVKVGDTVKVIKMEGEPHYKDREGVVTHIDDDGQIHGTWGGHAIIPEVDTYIILKRA